MGNIGYIYGFIIFFTFCIGFLAGGIFAAIFNKKEKKDEMEHVD